MAGRLAAAVALLAFATSGQGAAKAETEALRVLFIGNSFTYFHDLKDCQCRDKPKPGDSDYWRYSQ